MVELPPGFRIAKPGAGVPSGFRVAAPADASPRDWQDQVSAGFTSAINAIPIAGPSILSGLEQLKANIHGVPVETIRAEDRTWEQANPVASTTGTVAGTVAPFVVGGAIPAVAKTLGMTGNLGTRVAMGSISGAGISAADAGVRGGDAEDVRNAATVGGALGGALPVVGKVVGSVFKGGARPAKAPMASTQKAGASASYEAAKKSGAVLDPATMNVLGYDIRQLADDFGAIMPSGKVVKGFGNAKAAMKAVEEYSKGPISVAQALKLRNMFANVAGSSSKPERALGVQMLDKLDEFFDTLPDRAFTSGNGPEAMQVLRAAKDEYARAARTGTIEKLIRNARLDGGGEQAIRSQFRQLLKNDKRMRGFSPEEIAAMEDFVTRGSPVGNLFRLLARGGGLPAAGLSMTGVQTGMNRMAQTGAAELRDMVASGSGAPVKETGGEFLKRLIFQDTGGTSAIGGAGYGALANRFP